MNKLTTLQQIQKCLNSVKELIVQVLSSTVDALSELQSKIPTKTSELENDSGFLTSSTANTTYELKKDGNKIKLIGSDKSETNVIDDNTVYTHPDSGVKSGTYKSVTVDTQGHVTGGTNPTTLSGYGITDAANKVHEHTVSEIKDFPKSMPASDVSAWAKASNKPTYTASEIGLGNVDNTADSDKSVKHATTADSAAEAERTNFATESSLAEYAENLIGVLGVAKGGTGKTTAQDAAYNLLDGLTESTTFTDGNMFITRGDTGNETKFYKKSTSKFLEWLKSKLATVATTGSYNDLTNKPTIPAATTIVNNLTSTATTSALSAAQGKALNDNKLDKTAKAASASTADSASKVANKITFNGIGNGKSYDGSNAVTVDIDSIFSKNIANPFTQSIAYTKGTLVSYEGKLYICKSNLVSANTPFSTNNFAEMNLTDYIVSNLLGRMKFGIDAEGNYGYIKAGADTVTPFNSGSAVLYQIKASTGNSTWSSVNIGWKPSIVIMFGAKGHLVLNYMRDVNETQFGYLVCSTYGTTYVNGYKAIGETVTAVIGTNATSSKFGLDITNNGYKYLARLPDSWLEEGIYIFAFPDNGYKILS